ncbi:uncharacterized protein RHO17_012702 [Thomomys bottae]
MTRGFTLSFEQQPNGLTLRVRTPGTPPPPRARGSGHPGHRHHRRPAGQDTRGTATTAGPRARAPGAPPPPPARGSGHPGHRHHRRPAGQDTRAPPPPPARGSGHPGLHQPRQASPHMLRHAKQPDSSFG